MYIENNAIICETRYDQKDHVLSFKDLTYIAYEWYDNYKDRKPFGEPDVNWKSAFEYYRFIEISKGGVTETNIDVPFKDEDLPF